MPIYQYQFNGENNTFEQSIQLTLKGLRGGHSGCDIHTGRANAIKVMARVLAKLSQNTSPFQLAEIRGGSIRNAIPREAVAILVFNGEPHAFESEVEKLNILLKEELFIAEPNLKLFLESAEKPKSIFTLESTEKSHSFIKRIT